MEHFYTLQGEGMYSGQAAYFIRLGGCDVGCVWCDVKESWDAGKHSLHSVDEITKWIADSKSPHAVVTGGEPLMYDLGSLCDSIRGNGTKTFLETSGAYPLS